jgi:DNA adenine methylase Dam
MINIENLIKSPLNYSGGKYKLLPQLIPLFPQNINTFIDIFGGAFNVGANIQANKIIYNEYDDRIFNLVKFISECDIDKTQLKIKEVIDTYKLGKNTKEEYIQLRSDYNKTQDSLLLFVLSAFSFNYQIRFNSKGEFNMPCGNRGYSKNMEQWFVKFNELVKTKNIEFNNKSFLDVDTDKLDENDFVYADPPYLQTIATYTENGAWNPEKEIELHNFLDNLHSKNVKFALSNTSCYHGKKNELLLQWADKYNIHNLDFNYTNNNRFNKDNTELTQEVLITNY